MASRSDCRAVLRPVRLRDRRRSVPGVEADARRSAAVLQRQVQLLCAESLRRRGTCAAGLADVSVGPRAPPPTSCSAASKYRRESCCSRIPPLHDLHRRLLSRVFTPRRMLAVEDLVREFCVSALDPLRGRRRFRLRRRSRCVHADADDRLPAGHPRGRPAADPRSQRQEHHGRLTEQGDLSQTVIPGVDRDVRRIHRVEVDASLRRSDDRTAQRGDRGTGRDPSSARAHRSTCLHRDDRRCGQRNHRSADRVHGPTAR